MIVVRGARTHNLRAIDVSIPERSLVAITGPSGAGKSSLAFDTIFAEAQRRYLEALAIRADVLPRPPVDSIDNLPPAIAIAQRPLARSSRSTIGTVTEIADALRVLYARVGTPHCPICGDVLRAESAEQVVDSILRQPEGTKVVVRAPILQRAAGDLRAHLDALRKDGYVRAVVDEVTIDLGEVEAVDKKRFPKKTHELDVVVDRLVVKEGIRTRATDSIELAMRLGGGRVRIASNDRVSFHSQRYACEKDNFIFPEIKPALFSFNAAEGACPTCEGTGLAAGVSQRSLEDEEATVERVQRAPPCPACAGSGLRKEARAVTIDNTSIADLGAMPLERARKQLASFPATPISKPLIDATLPRIDALLDIGLSALSLDRRTETLSTGEGERARIAGQLAGGLRGVLYVIDEPSRGMHPDDTDRLLHVLQRLRDRGSTVLLVEHDLSLIRAADHVIDIADGRVVAEGSPKQIAESTSSVTGPWLAGNELPAVRRADTRDVVKIADVSIPRGAITCVVGPSGSGKSTLVLDVIVPAAPKTFERVIAVDASPLGRSSRSNPATATGIMPKLRELFAALPDAKARGYKSSRFSTNVKGGRCETCQGEGVVRVEMRVLPDLTVPCPVCQGARFNRETLQVRYRGMSIADVLALSVDDAQRQFEAVPAIREKLDAMRALGLGYLPLGQSSTTLSGGEAQRVKLAREIARGARATSLYVLDEPTAGLHQNDIAILLEALVALRDQGNTVIVIEHDRAFASRCDHAIALAHGKIVATGAPSDVM